MGFVRYCFCCGIRGRFFSVGIVIVCNNVRVMLHCAIRNLYAFRSNLWIVNSMKQSRQVLRYIWFWVVEIMRVRSWKAHDCCRYQLFFSCSNMDVCNVGRIEKIDGDLSGFEWILKRFCAKNFYSDKLDIYPLWLPYKFEVLVVQELIHG